MEPGRGLQRSDDGTFVVRDYPLGETRYLEPTDTAPLVHDLENVGDTGAPLRHRRARSLRRSDVAARNGGDRGGVVIDIHSHVMTPEAQELVRPFFSPEKDPFFGYASSSTRAYNKEHIPEVVPALTLPDVRLRDMDRMGVDIQAISVMPPQYFYWTEPDLGGVSLGW